MKFYLHIGWHKTGSTAIQKFLWENRRSLLDRFGVLYPETGIFTVAHHLVAWSLQEPLTNPWALSIDFHEKAEDLFSGIFHEAKTTGASTILISSEEFVSKCSLDRLTQLLSGHEVHVIVYIRRQDLAAESYYGQKVRQFESRISLELEQFISNMGRWLDYTVMVDAWERAIPGVVMEPRVYDLSKFPQGNVVTDFLTAIGLDMSVVAASNDSDVNASLDPLSIRALARINATYQLNKKTHEEVVTLFQEIHADEDALQTGIFDSKARIAYLKQFESSNEALFRRWLNYPNIFIISSAELARYAAQDASMGSQSIENAVQTRLRRVAEYLANSSNSIKEHQMTDPYITSASSDKTAAPDGADELRDAAMVAISRGEWPQALDTLLEAHRRRPDGPFIRMLLAQVFLELGRAEEARPHMDAIPDISELEPLLSELRARVTHELLVNSAASTKTQDGFTSSFKKLFAKTLDSRKKN